MKDWFYISDDKSAVGPVDGASIQDLIQKGVLGANDRIWTSEYGKDWKHIHTTEFHTGLKPPPIPTDLSVTSPSDAKKTPANPVPVTIPAVGKFFKIILIIVSIPVGFFVLFIISEALSTTQYYATSIGMSISECRKALVILGATHSEADSKCSERIPKK